MSSEATPGSSNVDAPPESPASGPGRGPEGLIVALLLLATVLVLGLRTLPGSPLVALDDTGLDLLLRAEARRHVDTSKVVVVLVDDDSLERLGEGWPLRRTTWADTIEILASYGPSVIAIDAWFATPQPSQDLETVLDLADKLYMTGIADEGAGAKLAAQLDQRAIELDGDRRLASALGAGVPVVLGSACVENAQVAPADLPALFTIDEPFLSEPRLRCNALSGNLPALALASRGQAALDQINDPDGKIRRYPYATAPGEVILASLAAAAALVAEPEAGMAALERVAGLDQAAPFLRTIHPDLIDTLRLADLLLVGPDDPVLDKALRGRMVFVGVSAQGTEDLVYNSLGVAIPGVYLHANGAIDLLQDRHLHSDGAPAVWGLVLGALLLFAVMWGGHHYRAAPLVAGVALTSGVAWGAVGYIGAAQGVVLPIATVWIGLGSWAVVRMGYTWVRTDLARREAQAARERLLADLQIRNAELRETLDTLRRTRTAKERMEAELQIGRQIQLSMVPTQMLPFAGQDRVALAATLEPALEVGGDFYDYFPLDDHRVCFSVGDVSGKGVGAALFMAMTQTMLHARASLDPSSASIVTHANDELARDNDSGMFVTLFLGIIDVRTGAMTYTNAGHNPPYILKPDGSIHKLAQRHGPVVGAVEEWEFDEDTYVLAPGDTFLGFTDGVTEAMDIDNNLYSDPRLEKLLEERSSSQPQAILDVTVADVRLHQGNAKQADDITVLALQYLGPGDAS